LKLSILVLHNLGDPQYWRHALVEKELCLPLIAPEHKYIIHDSEMPLPEFVKDIRLDAIILTQTFLSKRNDPTLYRKIRSNYDFIKDTDAFKIALPQDDYTCCNILDKWMIEWNIDLVYTVCHDHWDVLYKNYYATGRLVQGYTGYISNNLIRRGRDVKLIENRPIDVSYRAASLSPVFGKLGKIKTEIGELFEKAAQEFNLNLDLSTKSSATITGTAWFDFIENSKSMLGVNSGSSLLDPEGLINIKVYNYVQLNPSASYEEIEAKCFPGLDGKYIFTAISPRNIECALLKTTQLLTPGTYSNFIKPWEHYLPIEPDMSNIRENIAILKNVKQLEKITSSCKNAILSYPELRYENHVADLLIRIKEGTQLSGEQRDNTIHLIEKYKLLISKSQKFFWMKKRFKLRLRGGLANMGARKVKYFIMNLLTKSRD
jgi:hypothetical protein